VKEARRPGIGPVFLPPNRWVEPRKEFVMLTRKQLIFIFLFFFAAALAGVVLGALVAQRLISIPSFQVALFAIAALSIFVLGLGMYLWSKTKDAQELLDRPAHHELISGREEYPRALVPAQESNPELRIAGLRRES